MLPLNTLYLRNWKNLINLLMFFGRTVIKWSHQRKIGGEEFFLTSLLYYIRFVCAVLIRLWLNFDNPSNCNCFWIWQRTSIEVKSCTMQQSPKIWLDLVVPLFQIFCWFLRHDLFLYIKTKTFVSLSNIMFHILALFVQAYAFKFIGYICNML